MPLTIYNCVFRPNFLDFTLNSSRNFTDITNSFIMQAFLNNDFINFSNASASGKDNNTILNIYNKMLYEYTRKEIGYTEILRGFLIELIVTILRLKNRLESSENTFDLSDTIEYILKNFKNNIRIKDLADNTFLSPSHFCRKFKCITGITVTEFIQKIRIEEACKLIVTTDKKIIAIANEVGYKDIKHFNEIFKRHTNKNPSNFKKSNFNEL